MCTYSWPPTLPWIRLRMKSPHWCEALYRQSGDAIRPRFSGVNWLGEKNHGNCHDETTAPLPPSTIEWIAFFAWGFNYSASTLCTKATAIDPSPTADATRLTFPPRTSPTAKTPGRLVSSKYGGRAGDHFAFAR